MKTDSTARKILTAPARGVKALTAMIFRRESWRSFALPGSVRNYAAAVGDGTGSSTVMAPLLWIARNFPEAPPMLRREIEGGSELEGVPTHPLLRLLVRPNEHYSGTTLWMATMLDWYVDGNAYWIKIRDAGGRVRELWWAPSSLMNPKGSETEFISHYEYRPGSDVKILEPQDVVHYRFGLDSTDPRRGYSPLKSVLREVFTDDEAATFTAALLKNAGVPGLIVSPKDADAEPTADDVAATKAKLMELTTGDRRGEPLVMSGPTEIKQFGFSPAQLDLKSLRRLPEERVTAVLGVPAIVAGLGAGLDRSTFANFAEARAAAYQENIIPAQRIIGEEIRFQLLGDFEQDVWSYRVGFDTSRVKVMQEDEEKRARRLSVGVTGGWIQVAEARREMGLDAEAADEIYLRSFSTLEVPVGDAGRLAPPAGEPVKILEAGGDGSGRPQGAAGLEGNDRKGLSRPARATREQARLMRQLQLDEIELAGEFSDELLEDFDELGELCAGAFTDLFSPTLLASAEPARLKVSDEAIAAQILSAIDLDKWTGDTFRRRYETHYGRTAERTVGTINKVLALGVGLSDETMRAVIHRGGTRLALLETSKSTREAIVRAVALGRDQALGPIEIARQIQSEVPAGRFVHAGPEYRARLIARTETKFAQNVSSLEAYGTAQNVEAVIAFDARLGDSDEDCEQRDGQTFTFEQADAELSQEHPNGTLSFAPIVADSLD